MARTVVSNKPIPEGIVWLEPKKKAVQFVWEARLHLYKPELWNEQELLGAKESALFRVDAGRMYYSQEAFTPFWDKVDIEIRALTIEDLFEKKL